MKTDTLHSRAEQAVKELLMGPVVPDRPFTGKRTHGDVFAMARTLLDSCPPTNSRRESLGIFTEDRAVIAAAILAALTGGPVLVFPNDISDAALKDLNISTGLTQVVTDPGRKLTAPVKRISLSLADRSRETASLQRSIDPDAPLLRLHTGGSTGKPSIWTKTVKNMMAEAVFHLGAHRVTPDDVIVATVPPYHIYGLLFSVVIPLLAEASVADRTCGFPQEIVNTVVKKAATLLVSVPTHFRALKGHGFPAHGLRLAFSSAGTLDREDEAAFRSKSRIPVMEVYGSTETGGIAFRCRAHKEAFFTPFDTIKTEIVDNELSLRSPFVSPEIRRDDHGFCLAPDRVELSSGNSFAIIGRSDTIVKIAGKRVDLDDVKAVLKEMPGIRDVFVYGRPVPTVRAYDIHALIEGDCRRSDIQAFLSGRLDASAHPRRFRIIEKMPMTRAGKYDRSAIETLFDVDSGRME